MSAVSPRACGICDRLCYRAQDIEGATQRDPLEEKGLASWLSPLQAERSRRVTPGGAGAESTPSRPQYWRDPLSGQHSNNNWNCFMHICLILISQQSPEVGTTSIFFVPNLSKSPSVRGLRARLREVELLGLGPHPRASIPLGLCLLLCAVTGSVSERPPALTWHGSAESSSSPHLSGGAMHPG